MVLNIAKEFSPVPIGRRRKDSPTSGEAFREDMLRPRLDEAIRSNKRLEVDFDGMMGLSDSFLKEAFGGLVRTSDYSAEQILATIFFTPEGHLVSFVYAIREYIQEAEQQ